MTSGRREKKKEEALNNFNILSKSDKKNIAWRPKNNNTYSEERRENLCNYEEQDNTKKKKTEWATLIFLFPAAVATIFSKLLLL